ncbi:IPT/TIG domain-containing protein [Bradyrhizobium sp. Arg816]|uniref:IPT/TIG domain-containing protein n=1 Tax=Bradyrhizobium sp. Arg816 TaxID=2998491 RepID=UPI00249E4199|nr:IPT/TIG domain-containing protein [Bradyrhizobium sp. Arg816]MDI3565674.1 IPT/TIG domain-containing protein [Bradyrhizobium sp. Arg816]
MAALGAAATVFSTPDTRADRKPAPANAAIQIAQAAPTITGLSPESGRIGTLITLRGSGFTLENMIHFRGDVDSFDVGPIRSDDGATLQFEVNTCPPYQPRCPARYLTPGPYGVTVSNSNGRSQEVRFVLTARAG